MARSVIFFTTPTSATSSMFRVVTALSHPTLQPLSWVAERYAAQRIDRVAKEVRPAQSRLVMHNASTHLSRETRLCADRSILNARAPRGVPCYQIIGRFRIIFWTRRRSRRPPGGRASRRWASMPGCWRRIFVLRREGVTLVQGCFTDRPKERDDLFLPAGTAAGSQLRAN